MEKNKKEIVFLKQRFISCEAGSNKIRDYVSNNFQIVKYNKRKTFQLFT